MPRSAKKPVAPELGRKAAYVARNRSALLKSTQEVLAIKGQSVTIEDIAEHAEIAVSTVYKHFKDKDALIEATMLWGFASWEEWALNQIADVEDPLEQLVIPMRLFVRAHISHPHHAQSFVNFFGLMRNIAPKAGENLKVLLQLLAKIKVLNIENPEVSAKNIYAILAFTLLDQTTNPKASVADADTAIRSALSMIGISEAKAKKITESKLPDLTV
jgi:AcrR family transcriptional regulator